MRILKILLYSTILFVASVYSTTVQAAEIVASSSVVMAGEIPIVYKATLSSGSKQLKLSDLKSISLTLREHISGNIINNRFEQNVLNVNGIKIDDSGNITWVLDQQDYTLYSNIEPSVYIATFTTTFNKSFAPLSWDFEFPVFSSDDSIKTSLKKLSDVIETAYALSGNMSNLPKDINISVKTETQPNTVLDLSDYALVWSDEFQKLTLDDKKWKTSHLWGPDVVTNNTLQRYVDIQNVDKDLGYDPFSFTGDTIKINLVETPPELLELAGNQPYLSGIISSYDAFKYTYGYTEVKAKITPGNGYWTEIVMWNHKYIDKWPEIDLLENLGEDPYVTYHTYHIYKDQVLVPYSPSKKYVSHENLSQDFHTYGVEWLPGVLRWFVDGQEVLRLVTTSVSSQDAYIALALTIGGVWPVPPDATTPIPGVFEIDYVRVYQKK